MLCAFATFLEFYELRLKFLGETKGKARANRNLWLRTRSIDR